MKLLFNDLKPVFGSFENDFRYKVKIDLRLTLDLQQGVVYWLKWWNA